MSQSMSVSIFFPPPAIHLPADARRDFFGTRCCLSPEPINLGFAAVPAVVLAARRLGRTPRCRFRIPRAAAEERAFGNDGVHLPSSLLPEEILEGAEEGDVDAIAELGKRLKPVLRSRVRAALTESLEDEVWEDLKVQLRRPITDELKEQLEDEVRRELELEHGMLDDADAVDEEEGEEEDEHINEEEDVSDTLNDDVDDVDDEDDSDVAPHSDEETTRAVERIMADFPSLPQKLKLAVEARTCAELRTELEPDVREQLSEDFAESVVEMLRSQLVDEARFELREELEEEVRSDAVWSGEIGRAHV
eukprot:TRINITY_DN50976_c0_g1_i1.p1 TRINITY_DN50976_c0_g1~~TRINITY_DN50976_c0_g1_i1.p1  ORF type:complete len:326 (-),score=79.37 TRINITY_DN50976_c0_g1_i1:2-919(-)